MAIAALGRPQTHNKSNLSHARVCNRTGLITRVADILLVEAHGTTLTNMPVIEDNPLDLIVR